VTEEGQPKLTPKEQEDVHKLLHQKPENPFKNIPPMPSEHIDLRAEERARLEKLEAGLEEQKKINEGNARLLEEIAGGLKTMLTNKSEMDSIKGTLSHQRMMERGAPPTNFPADQIPQAAPPRPAVAQALKSEVPQGGVARPVTRENLKGFKKGLAPIEKGTVVGACVTCLSPVRLIPQREIPVCPKCGILVSTSYFAGPLCGNCPHVLQAHENGVECKAVMPSNEKCPCGRYEARSQAAIENHERVAFLDYLNGDNVQMQTLDVMRAAMPTVVFYRATREWLDKHGKDPNANQASVRAIGRQSSASYTEMIQENAEVKQRMKVAAQGATPIEEHDFYAREIGKLIAAGKPRNHPEILHYTRKAGEAWGKMSDEEKEDTKRRALEAEQLMEEANAEIQDELAKTFGAPEDAGEEEHDPGCDILDIDPAIGRPTKPCNCGAEPQESEGKLDPNRMFPAVKGNVDEQRAVMAIDFAVTRSQVATLEWAMEHWEQYATQRQAVLPRPTTVEETAAQLLLPNFMFMLNKIALARQEHEKGAGGMVKMKATVGKRLDAGTVIAPGALKAPKGPIPLRQDFEGPTIGEAMIRHDRRGDMIVEAELSAEDAARLQGAMGPPAGFSIGGHGAAPTQNAPQDFQYEPRLPTTPRPPKGVDPIKMFRQKMNERPTRPRPMPGQRPRGGPQHGR
jgi:hypothetical protein